MFLSPLDWCLSTLEGKVFLYVVFDCRQFQKNFILNYCDGGCEGFIYQYCVSLSVSWLRYSSGILFELRLSRTLLLVAFLKKKILAVVVILGLKKKIQRIDR